MLDCRIRFLECDWKVEFEEQLWKEIVRGVTQPEINEDIELKDAKKETKNKSGAGDNEDDSDHDDEEEEEDSLMRPVNIQEDDMYGTAFKKLFGVLKDSFMAVTENVSIPHYAEGALTVVSLKSRIQSEWDMESIVGVNIWGRENIPVPYADGASVAKIGKSKQTHMSQESKNDEDSDESDSDYSPDEEDDEEDDDNDGDKSEGSKSDDDDFVTSQCSVEKVALDTPLWINRNGFIENKMRSKIID